MALSEKEGNDDEVAIDEDDTFGTENNNNVFSGELNDALMLNYTYDLRAQEEGQVGSTCQQYW